MYIPDVGNIEHIRRYRIDASHYRFGPAGELVEHAPSQCPQGHPLGGDQVLVGNIPCMCLSQTHGQRAHRSWRCRRCDREWIWPGCTAQPDLPTWDGATPAPRGRHR
ncbi:hypothetical protein [Micromonospora sp.]|uniref:hypothetical protein n=1 Tax=Micromonospora sp. TaxID=1876 RepID=UPI003B3BB44D